MKQPDKTQNQIAIVLLFITVVLLAASVVCFLESEALLHGTASGWYTGFLGAVSTTGFQTVITSW